MGGEFEDEGAGEIPALQLAHEPWPINVAFSGREVVVVIAAVVVHVDEVEVAGEFVCNHAKFPAEVGVAGVEAGADLAIPDAAEEVKHIIDVAKEQVGEHVFEEKVNAEFTATIGNGVERLGGVTHAGEEFLLGWAARALGTGMENEVFRTHGGGGFASDQQFSDGHFPHGGV